MRSLSISGPLDQMRKNDILLYVNKVSNQTVRLKKKELMGLLGILLTKQVQITLLYVLKEQGIFCDLKNNMRGLSFRCSRGQVEENYIIPCIKEVGDSSMKLKEKL